MKNLKSRALRLLSGLVLICAFAVGAAQADTITFVATTPVINGTSVQQGPFLNFTVTGATDQTPLGVFAFAGQGTVDFRVANPDGSFPSTGTSSYTLPTGDRLTGAFVQSFFPPDANGISQFTVLTTITGGTGIFAGATGTITSVGSFNNITSIGRGIETFSITAPGLNAAAIPEPGSLLLLGTGLAGAAAAVRRCKNRDA
jgi:hypothetical protein